MLDHAWIIPLIPAASFFLILFFGKRMPRKGSEIGLAALGLAFALALVTNVSWWHHVDDSPEQAVKPAAALVADGESAAPAAPAAHAAPADEEKEAETVAPVTKEWTWFQNGGVDIKIG